MTTRKLLFLFLCWGLSVGAWAQKGARLQTKPALVKLIDGNLRQAANQYKVMMGKLPADRLPRTFYAAQDRLETSGSDWWCSGFYPGSLLYLYAYTHDTSLLHEARQRLTLLEKEQFNKGTHDLGFMMYCSFGNARRILPSENYNEILLNSARSLSTRFNPRVGCIRSWDSKPWKYPVIIDNMMNLELLFWATKYSGDSSFYRIAVTHANTTMKNHFRPDFSSYHVIDYDTASGEVLAKKTAQGYSDSSAWARGQSWGLYGYTVMYRSTGDKTYLALAERIAAFILHNPALPADKIPVWDYSAPAGYRDASAGAIMASALIELSHYVDAQKGQEYLDVAEKIIVGLSSNNYKAVVGSNGGFILKHSVGHLPGKSEVDVPLTYADYYFIEAMLRYRDLNNPRSLFYFPYTTSMPRQVAIGEGWARNSVNTVIFRHNSLITVKDTQFVAYYDAAGRLVLGKRRIGEEQWQLRTSAYKGHAEDAHNTISLAADRQGYLHVSWDHHNNVLRYCRSLRPGSLDLGEKIAMTGQHEDKVSYPEFYPMPGGDLIFLYRDGASGSGNLVIDHYDVKSRQWRQVQSDLIDGEGTRNAYWQACVDDKGVIHLSWVWRESPDVASNHDLCYARSSDGGVHWQKSNGQAYRLPITAATAEYAWRIPQKSELINQTSMFADGWGHPYIASYWRGGDDAAPQYQLVWQDGKKWNQQTISSRSTAFSLAGGGTKKIPISRPQFVMTRQHEAVLVFRDAERDNRVSISICRKFPSGVWETRDLTATSVGAWEPSYDPQCWKLRGELDLFVQHVEQGDGETPGNMTASTVSVLEWKP